MKNLYNSHCTKTKSAQLLEWVKKAVIENCPNASKREQVIFVKGICWSLDQNSIISENRKQELIDAFSYGDICLICKGKGDHCDDQGMLICKTCKGKGVLL